MSFINVKNKKLHLCNRNLFYLGTIIIVFVITGAFLVYGNDWAIRYVRSNWSDVLNFNNLIACFLSAFEHSNLQHCILNSFCFLIAGSYVERKIGTINLLLMVFAFAFFCECAVSANHSGDSHGFSGVNYAFYAYIIIDYIFMFIGKTHNKVDVIYGAIILALIYLAWCFCGGTSKFSFATYPYDLVTNMGHYTSFLTGAILTLLSKFIKWQAYKEKG